MAKRYIKPTVTFERLSMGSGAAGGCEYNASFAEFSCPVLIPEWGETIFTADACDWSNDDYNICYHVPMAASNVFGS